MKIKLLSLLIVASSITSAEYVVNIPLNERISFSNWSMENPLYGEWENIGSVNSCFNWSPASTSVAIGTSFIQKATDCKQSQTRTVQNRETDSVSGNIRNSGSPYNEDQVINVTQQRDAIGSLETWLAITPDYTNWVNDGVVTNCTNWAPETNTINMGVSFTQTATDCQQKQTRNKQDREQETTTNQIRNTGSVQIENKTITATSTQTNTGTKPTTECKYSRVDGPSEFVWLYVEDEGYLVELFVTWGGNVVYQDYVSNYYEVVYPDVRGSDGKLYRRGVRKAQGYEVCQVN